MTFAAGTDLSLERRRDVSGFSGLGFPAISVCIDMIGWHFGDLGYDTDPICDKSGTVQLAAMDNYRLFGDDGELVGSAVIIHAANDDEAMAQAEVVRGSLPPSYSI